MASLLMLLTAVDEGLDACFFGIQPDQLSPFRSEFGIPDDYAPIGGITVGHRSPDTPAQPTAVEDRRRHVEAVVHRGQFRAQEHSDGERS
jgi:nitroreductase